MKLPRRNPRKPYRGGLPSTLRDSATKDDCARNTPVCTPTRVRAPYEKGNQVLAQMQARFPNMSNSLWSLDSKSNRKYCNCEKNCRFFI